MIYQPLLALEIKVQAFTKQSIYISLPSLLCKKMQVKKNIIWNENVKIVVGEILQKRRRRSKC
jgi:hypothetical protein